MLDRSLAAFALLLAGDRAEAISAMAGFERECAQRYCFRQPLRPHPYVNAVDRLALADWLLEAGDPARAAEFVTWYQAVLPGPEFQTSQASWSVSALAMLRQAEAEEALGRTQRAIHYYRRFLQQLDAADPSLQPLIRKGEDALARLS